MEFFPIDERVNVTDYPYGFRERTTLTHWVEVKKWKGMRHVTQTVNPKTWKPNKPKASTYSAVVRLYKDEESGHVKAYHWTPYDCEGYEKARDIGLFEGVDFEHERVMRGVVLSNLRFVLWFTGFSINGNDVENPLECPRIPDAEMEALKDGKYETAKLVYENAKRRKDEANNWRTI